MREIEYKLCLDDVIIPYGNQLEHSFVRQDWYLLLLDIDKHLKFFFKSVINTVRLREIADLLPIYVESPKESVFFKKKYSLLNTICQGI